MAITVEEVESVLRMRDESSRVLERVTRAHDQLMAAQQRLSESTRRWDEALSGVIPKAVRAGVDLEHLDALFSRFRGDDLARSAHEIAFGVEAIGGAAKLTQTELTDVTRTIDEAVEKANRMGVEPPEAVKKLHGELKELNGGLKGLLDSLGPVGRSLAGAFSVGAILAASRAVGQHASTITEYAARLHTTTDAVQRLQFVTDLHGTSLEAISTVVQHVSRQLDGGDTSYVAALREVGIAAENLRGMELDQVFATIGSAVANVNDPIKQNALAWQLLGRSGSQLLPMLKAMPDEMGKAVVIHESLIEQGNRLDGAYTRLYASGKAFLAEAIAPSAPLAEAAAAALAAYNDQLRQYRAFMDTTQAQQRALAPPQAPTVGAPGMFASPTAAAGLTPKEQADIEAALERQLKLHQTLVEIEDAWMGRNAVEKATNFLLALQRLDAEGSVPLVESWDEILTVITEAQSAMARTGEAGSTMYQMLEAARRRFTPIGVNPDPNGPLPSFSSSPVMQAPSAAVDLDTRAKLIQAHASVDEMNNFLDMQQRFDEAQQRLEQEMKEGLIIVGEIAAGHERAAAAAVVGTTAAAQGYDALTAAMARAQGMQVAMPAGFNLTKAYEDAGFMVHDRIAGNSGARPFAGFEAAMGGASQVVNVGGVTTTVNYPVVDDPRALRNIETLINRALTSRLQQVFKL